MPDRDQRHAFSSSFEGWLPHGLGAMGLRLRLTRELSAGCVTLRHAITGKLLFTSPVINQR
jgi:hypothetical protein